MSASATPTVAAFADAQSAHRAAVAALNGGSGSGVGGGGISTVQADSVSRSGYDHHYGNSPSIVPSSSPLAAMSSGGAVPDKLQAAAAAAAKRKGGASRPRGRPRSSSVAVGCEDAGPGAEFAGADTDSDAASGARGKNGGSKRKPPPSRQEKMDLRINMRQHIRKVYDLTAQEEWLNARGRRTLRDPLDDEAISPSCTLIRGCIELYQVRSFMRELRRSWKLLCPTGYHLVPPFTQRFDFLFFSIIISHLQVPNTSVGETITKKGAKFKSGPFKDHSPGEVCLRCVFCAPHLTDDEKGSRGSRGFPMSSNGIDMYTRNFYRSHLKNCPHIPAKVNDLLKTVRDANLRRGNSGGGKYHERAIGRLNLVDSKTENGFSFGKGGMKFADGTTWADRGYGNGPGMRPIPTGPPAVVPIADGAEVAGSGSTTVDVDAPFVPSFSGRSAASSAQPKSKRGKPRKRSEPGTGTGAKRGRKPKKAKVETPAQKELEMAPFVAETTDSTITVGGMPPSFFGGFDDFFGGVGDHVDSLVTPSPAAVSPPQEFDLHGQSYGLPPSIPSKTVPEAVEASEPQPKSQPKQPVLRTSRSGRVSKRRNWDDFATDEADIEERISGAEQRDRSRSRSSSAVSSSSVGSTSGSTSAPRVPTAAAIASLGKTLSAYKTPRKSDPVDGAAPENGDDGAWEPGMESTNAATVTPTPSGKAKSKPKKKAKAAKKPRATKAKKKKSASGGTFNITYSKRNGMNTGKWTDEEEALLIEAMKVHDRDWSVISDIVGTRTPVSIHLFACDLFADILGHAYRVCS